MTRPLILVSNDDGVHAEGNTLLREALDAVGEVWTVAPLTEQSTNSHSLTLHRPLRHKAISERVHAVDGTPADCTYVALFYEGLLPRRPDVVVSGINHGPNLGADVHYSGTVAAAREAALRGLPSIAFSAASKDNLPACAALACEMVRRMLEAEIGEGATPLLNVNFPAGEIRGVRTTRLGRRTYRDEISVRVDPRGREYLWIGGPGPDPHERVEGSDTEAVDEGYASVTPLALEVTYGDHFGIATWVAGPDAEPPPPVRSDEVRGRER